MVALKSREEKKNNAANIVNHPTSDGSSSDENTHPNNASTRIRIGTSKDETTSPSKGRNKKRRVTPSSPPSLPLLPPSPQSHQLQSSPSIPLLPPRSSPPPSLHQPSLPLLPQEECREIVVNKCRGVYEGSFGQSLTVFAKSLRHTANEVLGWVQHPDRGLEAFANSIFATTRALCLPYYGMIVERAQKLEDGFMFRRQECTETCNGKHNCCSACLSRRSNSRKEIKRLAKPTAECPGKRERESMKSPSMIIDIFWF